MRLNRSEIETILKMSEEIFGKAEVHLFGSRLDPKKKGGDIDLFIVPEDRTNLFEKKIKALAKLERALCKPVDIVVHRDFERVIEREILQTGIILRHVREHVPG